jgi:acetate kinase
VSLPLRILCLNTGSSSLKFALYEMGEREVALTTGAADGIGSPGARLSVAKHSDTPVMGVAVEIPDARAAMEAVLAALDAQRMPTLDAVGHRLVHGGPEYRAPVRVNARLLETLKALVPFAPLHLPAEIDGVEAVARRFPDLPQVVVDEAVPANVLATALFERFSSRGEAEPHPCSNGMYVMSAAPTWFGRTTSIPPRRDG